MMHGEVCGAAVLSLLSTRSELQLPGWLRVCNCSWCGRLLRAESQPRPVGATVEVEAAHDVRHLGREVQPGDTGLASVRNRASAVQEGSRTVKTPAVAVRHEGKPYCEKCFEAIIA